KRKPTAPGFCSKISPKFGSNFLMIKTDFLIIGSGVGGLLAALKLQEAGDVTLITKRALEDGATDYAQGGIAAVTNREDSFASHIADTMKAGAGLCERKTVDLVVEEGPARVRELIERGVHFSLRD